VEIANGEKVQDQQEKRNPGIKRGDWGKGDLAKHLKGEKELVIGDHIPLRVERPVSFSEKERELEGAKRVGCGS